MICHKLNEAGRARTGEDDTHRNGGQRVRASRHEARGPRVDEAHPQVACNGDGVQKIRSTWAASAYRAMLIGGIRQSVEWDDLMTEGLCQSTRVQRRSNPRH